MSQQGVGERKGEPGERHLNLAIDNINGLNGLNPIKSGSLTLEQRTQLLIWHSYSSTTAIFLATSLPLAAITISIIIFARATFPDLITKLLFIAAVVVFTILMVVTMGERNNMYEAAFYEKYCQAFALTNRDLIRYLQGNKKLHIVLYFGEACLFAVIIAVVCILDSPHGTTVGLAAALFVTGCVYSATVMRSRAIARNQPDIGDFKVATFQIMFHEFNRCGCWGGCCC